jgi:hypothetical protein
VVPTSHCELSCLNLKAGRLRGNRSKKLSSPSETLLRLVPGFEDLSDYGELLTSESLRLAEFTLVWLSGSVPKKATCRTICDEILRSSSWSGP